MLLRFKSILNALGLNGEIKTAVKVKIAPQFKAKLKLVEGSKILNKLLIKF